MRNDETGQVWPISTLQQGSIILQEKMGREYRLNAETSHPFCRNILGTNT
jgi:hypothetical protein